MVHLKRIGLFIGNLKCQHIAAQTQSWLNQHHIESETFTWKTDTSNLPQFDAIISLGGDGALLFVVKHFPDTPALAVNYGTIGFLTAGNEDDLEKLLMALIQGNCFLSERVLLQCHHPKGSLHVLNEVAIKNKHRMLELDCSVDHRLIRRIRGDGVIVGTPTGSTAYLLSAGAPIVMPEARCLILAGLNEYNFSSRNIILRHDVEVEIKIDESTRENEIYLTADGREQIPLNVGDKVTIKESELRAKLLFLNRHYFFTNLSSRLAW